MVAASPLPPRLVLSLLPGFPQKLLTDWAAFIQQMFPGRMALSPPSPLCGPPEELQELAFIERPIRRTLKVGMPCPRAGGQF